MPCPLAGRKPGDIDMLIVRENTEGEYTNLGGVMYPGTEREIRDPGIGVQPPGAERVLRYAFEAARAARAARLTAATKSNGIAISMPWWDQVVDAVHRDYPEVKASTSSTSTSSPRASCCSRSASTSSSRPTCSATSCPTWPGLHRHDRHRAECQPEPGAHLPEPVRAGARLGARHLWQNIANPLAMI